MALLGRQLRPVATRRLQHLVGSDEIGGDEGVGRVERAFDVALGREMRHPSRAKAAKASANAAPSRLPAWGVDMGVGSLTPEHLAIMLGELMQPCGVDAHI